MTKIHFARLAKVIVALGKSHSANLSSDQLHEIADQLALVCSEFNPRFNYDRFIEACDLVNLKVAS